MAGHALHRHRLGHDDAMRTEVLDGGRHGVKVGRRDGQQAALLLAKDGRLVQRVAEVLRHEQLSARLDVCKQRVVGWRHQISLEHIVNIVVADQVVRDALKRDADGLLDQAILLEGVRVHQGANKGALRVLDVSRVHADGGKPRVGAGVGLADALAVLLLLERSLLLPRGEWLVQLAIDEEVAEDAAGAPRDAIGPALNA